MGDLEGSTAEGAQQAQAGSGHEVVEGLVQQTTRTLADGSAAHEATPPTTAAGTDPATYAAPDIDGRTGVHWFLEWRNFEGSDVCVRRGRAARSEGPALESARDAGQAAQA